MDEDPDVGVIVIKGANGVYTSGGDVKSFPDIHKNKMSDLHWNIGAPERAEQPVICAMEKYGFGEKCIFSLKTLALRSMPRSPSMMIFIGDTREVRE